MAIDIVQITATILNFPLTNEPWLDIGYGKRPRVGALFQRFRPTWRVALENSLLREMIGIVTAAYMLADVIDERDDFQDVINIYTSTRLFPAFGFSSGEDALAYFRESIREYCETEPSNWPSVLARRVGITHIPDQELSAKLMVGSVRFAMNVGTMVSVLRQQHSGLR